MTKKAATKIKNNSGFDAIYVFGGVGALIFYFQQADTFWLYIVALFKAIFWPGYVIYDLLKFIHG